MCKSVFLLLFFAVLHFSFSQSENIDNLIQEALLEAKQTNKSVFINYLSTSCKKSKQLKNKMNVKSFKYLFNTNYVVVNIMIPRKETKEYVHCSNPMKSFNKIECKQIKFPFWNILNNEGDLVAVSFQEGEDLGFPTTKKAIENFIGIIRDTSKFCEVKLDKIASIFKDTNKQNLYTTR